MSDTPRTDEGEFDAIQNATVCSCSKKLKCVSAVFARQLERDITALREATIDECDRALSEAANDCRPIEQYYLHGLWKARHILALLKQKGSP